MSALRDALANTLRYVTDRRWMILGFSAFVAVALATEPVSMAWPQ
jgi:hypothetical protein